MNFRFVWKAFNVVTGETEGVYEQTIYGNGLVDAVNTWTRFHGDLGEDEFRCAVEITSITEVP